MLAQNTPPFSAQHCMVLFSTFDSLKQKQINISYLSKTTVSIPCKER